MLSDTVDPALNALRGQYMAVKTDNGLLPEGGATLALVINVSIFPFN